jgi:putative transposase
VGRKAREWWPNAVFHIVSRGNRKEALFHDHLDYSVFLRILGAAQDKVSFNLYAYCLMHNHFHLLISTSDQPISKLMAWLNKKYATYYNNRYVVCGHLFEKRYFSRPAADRYGILKVSRYIHRNPVEANITEDPKDYKWSSYKAYLGEIDKNQPIELNTSRILECLPSVGNDPQTLYKWFVEQDEEAKLENEALSIG